MQIAGAKLDRLAVLVVLSLAGVTTLAWAGTIRDASQPSCCTGICTMEGTLPHRGALFLGSWSMMMTAMMLPSIAPLLLLHLGASLPTGRARAVLGTACFAIGYLIVWAASALPAFAGMLLLGHQTWPVWVTALPAIVFILAGLYQLSPLKSACLQHCASPLHFLMTRWKPGLFGSLRMGLSHGAFCIACCWGLMCVLAVLGMMNLIWMAIFTVIMCLEKWLPRPHWLARSTGVLLLIGGGGMLVRAVA